MIRIADYIMKRIREENINHIFYVPGGQCVYLTDAVRRNEELKGVSTHHEQAAAMAAVAYARQNGNMGACLVTTGCAGTNTITGVLHAWQESVSCIFVSGQQNVEQTIAYSGLPLRQVGIQEADIVRLVTPITKYAVMITRPEDIAKELDKAIYMAREGRRGPVWIDVPLNIQNSMVKEERLERWEPEEKKEMDLSVDVIAVSEALEKAERPVLLAGNGIRAAGCEKQLLDFVEKYQIPTVFTRPSVDLLPYAHPLHFGVVSAAAANRYANFIVQNSDFVLSIGSRLSIETTGPEQKDFAREAKIIVVDIDSTEHKKNGVSIEKLIPADAGQFLNAMNRLSVLGVSRDNWLATCNHWKQIFPGYKLLEAEQKNPIDVRYFLERLSEVLPAEVTLISDAGLTGSAVPANCHVGEKGRLIHAYAQGEMGFVLPASVGVSCATENMVVGIVGDGSFMMNLQELQTIVRCGKNIKIVINNNNGYSGVRHGQKAHFRGKSIGTDPSNGIDFPDFEKVAMAFDISFGRIHSVDEIDEQFQKMMEIEGPYILEVLTDPQQFEYHNALVMYGKRKVGFRPIEDQSPFLDREIFFKEMVVEPLESSGGKPI